MVPLIMKKVEEKKLGKKDSAKDSENNDELSMLGVEEMHAKQARRDAVKVAVKGFEQKKKEIEEALKYCVFGPEILRLNQELDAINQQIQSLERTVDVGGPGMN